MKIVNIEQRTIRWYEWRQGGVGSSDAAVLVNGKHFGKDAKGLWAEKTSARPQEGFAPNWAMQQGINTEQATREWYENLTGVSAPSLCCEHETYGFIRASLDGWVAGSRVVLEIKYANKDDHADALAGRVPGKYRAQVNHQLLCTGATALHYLSHNPRFPQGQRYALAEALPDAGELRKLRDLEKKFWQCVTSRVAPVIS